MKKIVLANSIENAISESTVDGEGLRLVVFTCGCSHFCKGCHNEKTWKIENGIEVELTEVVEYLYGKLTKYPYDGLTLSGGDPLFQEEETLLLVKELKKRLPELNIWLYTGYLYEDIKGKELLTYLNVLVDGKFIEEKKKNLIFKGSENQRIICLENGKFLELWKSKY